MPNREARRKYLMRPGARTAVAGIFDGIRGLKKAYWGAFKKPEGKFPIDGRLVGDIGEAIAALDYGVELHETQRKGSDGTFSGKEVEVKATFQDHITFTKAPAPDILVLCLQFHEDGRYTEAYNGPSDRLLSRYWPDGRDRQCRPPVDDLCELAARVSKAQRIPRVRTSR